MTTRLARFQRWFRYYGHGPRHALMTVVHETRQYVRRWLSREVFFVACDRCGTVRKVHERSLPDTGQLLCPVCANDFEIAEIRAFLKMPDTGNANEKGRTFHKRVYYDHDDERHRELGL